MKTFFFLTFFFAQTSFAEMTKTQIGKLQSRVIISKTKDANAPIVYLIPGSGPHGPEEMMPPPITTDGKYHPLFIELAQKLNDTGLHAVMIGKPGIGFAHPDGSFKAYDKDMYMNLTWDRYIENIEEVITETLKEFPKNNRKYLLGHSEGTIATVFLAEKSSYDGIIQLGYVGRNLRKVLHYQASERIIEFATALDVNENKILEKSEWRNFPELSDFKVDNIPFQSLYELGEINYKKILEQYINFPLWRGDLLDGEDFYSRAAALSIPIYVFQGEVDVQTPVSEAKALSEECKKQNKTNCIIKIIPAVGHGFSKPKGPRMNSIFDATIGPMEVEFYEILESSLRSLVISEI